MLEFEQHLPTKSEANSGWLFTAIWQQTDSSMRAVSSGLCAMLPFSNPKSVPTNYSMHQTFQCTDMQHIEFLSEIWAWCLI